MNTIDPTGLIRPNPAFNHLLKKTGTPKPPGAALSYHQSETRGFTRLVTTRTSETHQVQNALFHFDRLDPELKQGLVYDGTPIANLAPDEAKALVSEDGYFGIAQTSQRIAEFVLAGAGDDLEKLKAGREGVLRGFSQAEEAWGGRLPDISYKTLATSLEAIDEKIKDLGGSVVDLRF